jgi:hypothetical protein
MNICKKCNKKIIIKIENFKKNSIFVCKDCRNDNKLYRKKNFDSLYLEEDLTSNLRCIYSENHEIYYKKSSINKILEKKYRKELIKKNLLENKIVFRNHGDVYSYIHYNNPSLDLVLNKLKIKQKETIKRKIKLHLELKKKGIVLNINLKSCYNYVHKLNDLSLEETIKNIEIESFLEKIPTFKKLNEKYNERYALKIALKNYKVEDKDKKILEKINNIVIKFD